MSLKYTSKRFQLFMINKIYNHSRPRTLYLSALSLTITPILLHPSINIDIKVSGIFKGNMHHKHDVSPKDIFSITDMAAGIFFWKFCTISKEAAKRYILSPQITFSSSSLFLLIRLRLPSPGWDGNLRLKRRKNEEKEKVKWGDKMCLFAYDAKFSTKNPSGHIYDIKGIF